MKKLLILICLSNFLLFSGCNSEINLKSTSLNSITINNIKIYDNIDDIDLNGYVKSNRFSRGNAKYYFENLVMDVNKRNQVNYLFGFYKENKVVIHGKSNLRFISDITSLLRSNYKEAWQDREQQLKYHSYYDKTHKLIFKVVYSVVTNEIVWVEVKSSD
ncbi:hypothetical protein [Bacillus sp. AFS017336]|uniref:hypothetical protein n=1 Tax=Bacillus sp. AFS017336 TaxID=2033489 RepID=UPI000BF08E8F|nr:hypothetical protein [Bacillus sp. AFS017336]PEL08321.1 hypothetical protein CN601_17030 [Bacillus sp. AFS017336]